MCNAHGEFNMLICPHEIYGRPGFSEEVRQHAYVSLFDNVVDTKEMQVVRNAVRFSMPTGDSRFQKQIERAINRKIGHTYRGRPRASSEVECK